MTYKHRIVRLALSRALLVFGTVWLAVTTNADSDHDSAENPRLSIPELPHLNGAQRAIVVDALHLEYHQPYSICSFELLAKLDYIPSRVERYDPRADKDSRWTLISIEGREPSERERKKTARYTRTSPEDAWTDLRQNIIWDSLNVHVEDEDHLVLVGLKNLEVGKDEFVSSEVTLVIDKVTRSLDTVTITMNETHKINFFATIAAMTMTQNYRYEPTMALPILDEILVDWKFRIFFAPSSSTEQLTYRDYDCQASD